MAPYNFDAPDTDAVLLSSDGKEFHVHRLILSLASPVFRGMFSLPQPTEPTSQIPTIDVAESSDILQPFLQCLYPRKPPKISDLAMWAALYTAADKYNAEAVMELLRDMLIPEFLETSPLRVYALASHYGFEEVAKIASTRTLTFDIFKDFPQEDAELMGGAACQKIYLLHYNRREAAQAVIANHPFPFSSCSCSMLNYASFAQALSQRVARRPWLTAEELQKEALRWSFTKTCGNNPNSCRNSFMNTHTYFTSILKGISELPRTI